jgi:hypothetical protein
VKLHKDTIFLITSMCVRKNQLSSTWELENLTVVWRVMTPSSLLGVHQSLGGTCYLPLPFRDQDNSTMNMDAIRSFETSVNIYHSLGRHITRHQNIQEILLWKSKVRYHINISNIFHNVTSCIFKTWITSTFCMFILLASMYKRRYVLLGPVTDHKGRRYLSVFSNQNSTCRNKDH